MSNPAPPTVPPAHTPTPWNIHPYYRDNEPFVVYETGTGTPAFSAYTTRIAMGEKIIGDLTMKHGITGGWPSVESRKECDANATLILTAVNSHADTLAAMQAALFLVDSLAHLQNNEPARQVADMLRAAIAKATVPA